MNIRKNFFDRALVAISALIVSSIATFRTTKISPEYVVVSRDGTILNYKGFKKYGIHVGLNRVPINAERDYIVPEYTISFNRPPTYLEVSTMEGAVARMKQTGPSTYSLRFVGSGYGSPIIESNFKAQAY